jgi:AAA15 family ATPase/GTPase
MFTQITLKNYRTHKSTTIELGPVTLLIGNNNSGKTNLLAGIQHFSWLVRRANPQHVSFPSIKERDYFPHRHRLASDDEVMSISVSWTNQKGEINYVMELYGRDDNQVGCREKMTINLAKNGKEISSGFDEFSNVIALRKNLESDDSLNQEEKSLCRSFFIDFAYTFTYHFQPSFLKGVSHQKNEFDEGEDKINIPAQLGFQGNHLQHMIMYVKEKEERVFSRFIALLRRFRAARNLSNVRYNGKNRDKVIWEFDFGRETKGKRLLEEFSPEVISDGILKAAAIALLVSLQKPPALILLEEIENGINPGNIQLLMDWIWQAAAPQFILTSHSPSVLREFHEYLDNVYVVRLDERHFRSDVRNLNTALETLVSIGTVEGEVIENERSQRVAKIPKYQLAELWYSGTIG